MKGTIPILLGLWCGLALAGCPTLVQGDDDDATGDDDAYGDDDAGPGADDGMVSLIAMNPGGMGVMGMFSASFYDIVTPATSGVVLNLPTGTDDCAITLFTMEELESGDAGEIDYLSAGSITLSGPTGDFQVEPMDQGEGVVGYSHQLLGANMAVGEAFDVTAVGDEFPGFSSTGGLVIPPEITLTDPSGSTVTLGGTLSLAWSGGESGEIDIMIQAWDASQDNGGQIMCSAANDGAFDIDGSLIDQLPTGGSVVLLFTQYHRDELTVSGKTVMLVGAYSVTLSGS